MGLYLALRFRIQPRDSAGRNCCIGLAFERKPGLVDGALTPLQRRQNLVAVSAAMAVTALIYGLSLPLLSLVMDARGVNGTLIGLSTAVQSIGIVLMAPFLPAYMSRSGPAVLMLGAILVSLVAFLLLPVFTSIGAWFVLRFLIGAAGGVLWVCGDAWVNEVATEKTRGRVVGIYGVAVAGGFSLGPLLLSVTGSDGYAPFLLSSAIMLLSALPLLPVVRIAPSLQGEPAGGLLHYLALAPMPMLMALVYAIAEAILLTFLPHYGIEQGLSEPQALYLIALIGIGGMLGQFPIGWLADHMNRLALGSLSILFVVVAAMAMPLVIAMPMWNLVFMLLLGAATIGIYTVGMVMIGEQFRGADLAAASALYGLMFGVGSILGPPVGGLARDFLPPHGVPISIAVMCAVLLPLPVISLLRRRRR
jgi:MFS family permease